MKCKVHLFDAKGCERGGFRDLADALDYLAKHVRADQRASWLIQVAQ